MILNAVKGLMGVIFPLITFPYVSKVLGVNSLGEYNFATSIISYIVLMAGLGINSYAIREGARIRENKEKFSRFADQMFSINVISTLFSYLVLAVLLMTVPKFQGYMSLILILSLQVAFNTIGVSWVYSIFEDYAYITVRSIIFQIISICLMFIFVKNEEHLFVYALITVIANVGANVFNFFHSRKYCNVRFTLDIDWKEHIKPILILFGMSATVAVYVSSDVTILGFVCGDYAVGIYSVSVKVYNIIKNLLASVVVVSIPRLSSLLGKHHDPERCAFRKEVNGVFGMLNTFMIPAVVGLVLLRREIVLLISDETYLAAETSFVILCVTMFFCLGAYFWGQAVLVPLKKEKTVLYATVVSALVNIGLNFVLIPIWHENAAALTTLISEALAYVWCMVASRPYVDRKRILKDLLKIAIGCAGIIAVEYVMRALISHVIAYMAATIAGAVLIYLVIEVLVKNEVIGDIVTAFVKKTKKETYGF